MYKKMQRTLSMAGILMLLGVASSHAQTSASLKAVIPFEFKVLNQTLPAGSYTISFARAESRDVIWIKNQDSSAVVNVITYGHKEKRMHDDAYLTFHRYGDQYFLAQVWTAYADEAREPAKSRSEKELLQSAAKGGTHGKAAYESVMVVAR